MPKTVRRKMQIKKKSKNKKKRKSNKSGASGGKRQKISGDASEIGETNESDALTVIPLPLITKEDGAAARQRQRHANRAETLSPPCFAVLYTKIEGRHVKYVPTGVSITFTSRREAGRCFGGMNNSTLNKSIARKCKSKINKGIHKGKYVMLSDIPVESIMFEGKEIKPAPDRVSERVTGQKYVVNGEVCICTGAQWKCVKHNKVLSVCGECGGASLCPCGKERNYCKICRVQPLLECTVCSTTWTSANGLKKHMRTHTGEKPYECHLCPDKFAQNGALTRHKGHLHDIGNEQCTKCLKNCYRPRSWINPETNDVEQYCKECYGVRFGVNIREEQEWSDWLDERFYPKFRTCSDTRISMCTRFRPDGLYEFEGPMILYVDHLILHWEFDEGQHQGEKYSGDENRMLKMHEIEKYKDKQWVTVRVNPHAYTHPARNKAKPGKEERKELMLKVMKSCLTKKWESRSHVVYLFYSKDNNNIAQNIDKTMLYDAEDVDNFCI
tara:strand:+ start:163 stop:1656 length:1494 start_codon:yes stop_codon:yes gene_type:complete